MLLIACKSICVSESIRVHYGKSFEKLRHWDAAPPGQLARKPALGELLAFLSGRGLSLESILNACVRMDIGLRAGKPRVPTRRPETTVDALPPFLTACNRMLQRI